MGAGKTEKKGKGRPEFIIVKNDFVIIIENKKSIENLEKLSDNENKILLQINYVNNYAVNGAVHYANHIISKTQYKKVIAIGCAGSPDNFRIQPYFVKNNEIKKLSELRGFENFSDENFDEYVRVQIKGELPKAEIELQKIDKFSAELNEDLRNYGNLENEKKATVVSAILLALKDKDFSIKDLQGKTSENAKDGDLIFNALDRYLKTIETIRPEKLGIVKENFLFIKNDVVLNRFNTVISMTPLKYYAQKLKTQILHRIEHGTPVDILGKFYSEFVRYGGADGNSLGIVLTPRHITELMVDLCEINVDSLVLDCSCGSGAFLISAMNKMISFAKDNKEKIKAIKQRQLYGNEWNSKMFTIATTNMVLRGDGTANLFRDDMFHAQEQDLKDIFVDCVLMNPPYSQAKDKNTKHLSEISFINKALDFLKQSGTLCVIVPQSTMVGKSKQDREYKRDILEKSTLKAVITLNSQTFYPVGTNPCICIFEAKRKHEADDIVKFIDFSNDGYIVRKHIGLLDDGTAKDKKIELLKTFFDKKGARVDNRFIIKTTISVNDEWLHSFYYFNNEIPADKSFEKTISDYLTFQIDMYLHNKGYLFKKNNGVKKTNEKKCVK
jgi:type I restriction-modification system DNA methylase subunit